MLNTEVIIFGLGLLRIASNLTEHREEEKVYRECSLLPIWRNHSISSLALTYRLLGIDKKKKTKD
jgi:hypothetical protein